MRFWCLQRTERARIEPDGKESLGIHTAIGLESVLMTSDPTLITRLDILNDQLRSLKGYFLAIGKCRTFPVQSGTEYRGLCLRKWLPFESGWRQWKHDSM